MVEQGRVVTVIFFNIHLMWRELQIEESNLKWTSFNIVTVGKGKHSCWLSEIGDGLQGPSVVCNDE